MLARILIAVGLLLGATSCTRRCKAGTILVTLRLPAESLTLVKGLGPTEALILRITMAVQVADDSAKPGAIQGAESIIQSKDVVDGMTVQVDRTDYDRTSDIIVAELALVRGGTLLSSTKVPVVYDEKCTLQTLVLAPAPTSVTSLQVDNADAPACENIRFTVLNPSREPLQVQLSYDAGNGRQIIGVVDVTFAKTEEQVSYPWTSLSIPGNRVVKFYASPIIPETTEHAAANDDSAGKVVEVQVDNRPPGAEGPRVSTNYSQIISADFDLDHHEDLGFFSRRDGVFAVLSGNGDGSFDEETDYIIGSVVSDVKVLDLGGTDDCPELVYVDTPPLPAQSQLVVRDGQKNGTRCAWSPIEQRVDIPIQNPVSLSTATYTTSADLQPRTAVAVTNNNGDSVVALQASGSPNDAFTVFASLVVSPPLFSGVRKEMAAFGDFMGDGKIDFVVAVNDSLVFFDDVLLDSMPTPRKVQLVDPEALTQPITAMYAGNVDDPDVNHTTELVVLNSRGAFLWQANSPTANSGTNLIALYRAPGPDSTTAVLGKFDKANARKTSAVVEEDKYLDLIFSSGSQVTVVRGPLGLSPSETSVYPFGANVFVVSDFSGDGIKDIVLKDINGGVQILRGGREGGFVEYPIGTSQLRELDASPSGKVLELPSQAAWVASQTPALVQEINDVQLSAQSTVYRLPGDEQPGAGQLGDLDGDGIVDVMLTPLEITDHSMYVYLSSAGNPMTPITLCANQQIVSWTTGDFDRDGVMDIVGASYVAKEAYFFSDVSSRNSGSDCAGVTVSIGFQPGALHTGKLAPDGRDAIFTHGSVPDQLSILTWNGTGFSFRYEKILEGAADLATADLDGDGFSEIVSVQHDGRTEICHLLEQGVSKTTFRTEMVNPMVALGDYNGDNLVDIYVTSRVSGRANVILNQRAATLTGFERSQDWAVVDLPTLLPNLSIDLHMTATGAGLPVVIGLTSAGTPLIIPNQLPRGCASP